MSFAGIILAAGASRRMGQPKALLLFEGETFLDRLMRIFAAHCGHVYVVLGHESDRIRRGIARGEQAEFVTNPAPEMGQLSSLQCGLRELAKIEGVDGVLMTPVDYPAVQSETVARLLEQFGTAEFVIPQFQGKHGHPICFRRERAADFLSLPPSSQPREVVHRYQAQTCYVEVADPGILRDIDDPQTYRDLLAGARK